MRRLRDLQPVELHAGTRRLSTHVLAVEGDSAVLAIGAADGPARRCRLVFTHDGSLVALEGTVDGGPLPGTARFTVADRAHVPQPRATSRLALVLEATVRLRDDAPEAAVACRVVDVSAGGLGLRGWTAAVGTPVHVTVQLPPDDRTLDLDARVVRSRPDGAGLQFEEADAREVGASINRLVLAYRATVVSAARRSRPAR